MREKKFQEVPRPGSVWQSNGELVKVKEATWNRVEFYRGETLCVLPGRLFHNRFEKVASSPAHQPALDHPVIQRFLKLRGRQTTSGHLLI